jgi:hypothetical protein
MDLQVVGKSQHHPTLFDLVQLCSSELFNIASNRAITSSHGGKCQQATRRSVTATFLRPPSRQSSLPLLVAKAGAPRAPGVPDS